MFLRGKNLVASAMGYAFDQKGQRGAISRIVFDFWYPGYLDSFCDFFNVISIMTETALYRYATPHFYTPDEFPEEYKDFTIGVFYPSPWKGGWWRFRDAVEYCLTASKSVLSTAVELRLSPLKQVVPPAGRVASGNATAYLLSPRTNNSYIAVNRTLQKGGQALWAQDSFSVGGRDYPAGTWILPAAAVSRVFLESMAKDLSLDVGIAGSQVGVKTLALKAPRVALYKPWASNSDEGWTRWLFEKYEFPFASINDAEVRAGGLGAKYDVVVLPSMSIERIVEGNRPETMPPQYVGGIAQEGVRNIRDFVEGGGTLVTLNGACQFALDALRLPVKDALADFQAPAQEYGRTMEARPARFSCPGSVLAAEFNPVHPVAYGMPARAAAMFYGSTAFEILPSFEGRTPAAVAKYPADKILMSGYLMGEAYLRNKAAVVDAPLGKGRVILLGFAVQNRAQPHGTFKLLFNSLYYGTAK